MSQDEAKMTTSQGNELLLQSDNSAELILLKQKFSLVENALDYEIEVSVKGKDEAEIGDLALYLPWSIARSKNPDTIFEKSFTQHQISIDRVSN